MNVVYNNQCNRRSVWWGLLHILHTGPFINKLQMSVFVLYWHCFTHLWSSAHAKCPSAESIIDLILEFYIDFEYRCFTETRSHSKDGLIADRYFPLTSRSSKDKAVQLDLYRWQQERDKQGKSPNNSPATNINQQGVENRSNFPPLK